MGRKVILKKNNTNNAANLNITGSIVSNNNFQETYCKLSSLCNQIIHKISDSHSSVVEDSSLLGCYTVFLDCLVLHNEDMMALQKH
jgi:hypothetical protein